MIMIKIMMPDTAGSKNTRICSTYSNGRIVPDGAGARVVSLTLFRLQSPCSFNDNVTIIVAMQHDVDRDLGHPAGHLVDRDLWSTLNM